MFSRLSASCGAALPAPLDGLLRPAHTTSEPACSHPEPAHSLPEPAHSVPEPAHRVPVPADRAPLPLHQRPDIMTPFTLPKALLERPINASRGLSGAPDLRTALGDEPTIVVFVRHLG